jgi:hypothetical protein
MDPHSRVSLPTGKCVDISYVRARLRSETLRMANETSGKVHQMATASARLKNAKGISLPTTSIRLPTACYPLCQ